LLWSKKAQKKHLLEEAQQKLIESEHKREESERKMDEAINLANEENKQALIEQERLKALLKNAGIDPDANIDKLNE
jgi:RNA polymerase-binding transcription factor DksA